MLNLSLSLRYAQQNVLSPWDLEIVYHHIRHLVFKTIQCVIIMRSLFEHEFTLQMMQT